MAYSSREMALTIKFVDDASGAIDSITQRLTSVERTGGGLLATGIALQRIGDAMGNIGKAGVGFFNGAIDAASEYSKQAALTLTQSDEVGLSLQRIKDIGKAVAANVAIPFEEIQPALFDIFSTTQLGSAAAEEMLKQVSRAAVAGNADIRDVLSLSIQQMNTYGLGTEELTHLLDLQFNTYKYGKGELKDFAASMGLSIPAAKAAGQSLENFSGAMAFMSKNAPTVANATASVGRAMELLYSPKGQAGLQKLGIDIHDANGKIKSMQQIVTELAVDKGWATLDEAQRKIAFKETFGTGAIQARRFFDAAIPNYKELNDITSKVADSQGAINKAYDIMSNEPANKAIVLRNEYMNLKTTIGDQLLPIKVKLMQVLSKMLDAWNKLSPSVQNFIIKALAIGAVFLAIAGPIISFIGSILTVIGLLSFLGGAIGGVAAIVGTVLVVLAALAAVGYLIYKNWDQVKPVLVGIWNGLKEAWDSFLSGFSGNNDQSGALGFMQDIGRYALDAWNGLKAFWDWLKNDAWPAAQAGWSATKDVVQAIWDKITEFWGWLDATFGPGFSRIWNTLKENIGPVLTEIQAFAAEFIKDAKDLYDQVSPIFDDIGKVVTGLWDNFIKPFLDTVKIELQAAWEFVRTYTKDVWDFISRLISDTITITANIIRLVLNILQGDWSGAWENIKNILKAVWDVIAGIVRFGWETVKALFWLGVNSVGEIGKYLINSLIEKFSKVPGAIGGVFASAGSWLWNAGVSIINGLIGGIESKFQAVKTKLQQLTSWLPSWKGPADVDRKLLFNNGQMIMQGLVKGLDDGMGEVKSYLNGITTSSNFTPNISVTGIGQTSSQLDLEDMTRRIVEAIHTIKPTNIENLQVGETKQVATLDFWGSVKNSGNS